MQLPEPVYQSDIRQLEVRRRPPEKNFRQRLRQIVSLYVPSAPGDGVSGDHTRLLIAEGADDDFTESGSEKFYCIKRMYSWKILVKTITDAIGVSPTLETGELREIVAIAADDHAIYLALQDLPYVFLLDSADSMEEKQHLTKLNRTESTVSIIRSHIQLHIPKIGDLYPQEICVYSPTIDTTVLYIVGCVKAKQDPQNTTQHEKKWLLAKFSLHGRPISLSAAYNYQRYSGLVVDAVDGKLLLTCPLMLDLANTTTADRKIVEQSAGQICKLTPNFERRVFSVTMGNERIVYRPEYVSQLSAGGCCWASVLKSVHDEKTGFEDQSKSSRRLFAFPTCQPDGEEKRSPREWLHLTSWDFADLTPGRVAAYDKRRLLVLDQNNGTLSYVTWSGGQVTPCLQRITRPASNPIKLLCASYSGTQQHDEKMFFPPVAYFVCQSSIYMFRFNEDIYA